MLSYHKTLNPDLCITTSFDFSSWIEEVDEILKEKIGKTVCEMLDRVDTCQLFFDFKSGIEPHVEADAICVYIER